MFGADKECVLEIRISLVYLVQGVAADVAGGSGEEYFDCHCGGWQVHWLKGWNPEKIFDLFPVFRELNLSVRCEFF